MKIPFVDLKTQYESIKDEIDEAIKTVFNESQFINGQAVSLFEEEFAKYIGVDYCISCANGTDALEIALEALGVGIGDEVLVPALSWISTASAVNRVGAEPVFIDVIEAERTINPELLEEKITDNTKAIIAVHLYGLPARMNELIAIAKKYKLKVIEDCAQSPGASINEKKTGTFGDIATFSFYPVKNLGAYGDGGAIVTNSKTLSDKCRSICNYGAEDESDDHFIVGRNSRLDTIQAAILRVKLKYLDRWNQQRIDLASKYKYQLKNVIHPVVPKGYKHVFHLYVIQAAKRNELLEEFHAQGFETFIHYSIPLPFLSCYGYKGHIEDDFPISEKLCREILSLPLNISLKKILS